MRRPRSRSVLAGGQHGGVADDEGLGADPDGATLLGPSTVAAAVVPGECVPFAGDVAASDGDSAALGDGPAEGPLRSLKIR